MMKNIKKKMYIYDSYEMDDKINRRAKKTSFYKNPFVFFHVRVHSDI